MAMKFSLHDGWLAMDSFEYLRRISGMFKIGLETDT